MDMKRTNLVMEEFYLSYDVDIVKSLEEEISRFIEGQDYLKSLEFARKVMLSMASKTYVYFPGGFGTMDELSEILCLMQEDKMPHMPVFLFGKSYWRPLERYFRNKFLKEKMIKAADLHIFKITDDLEDIIRAANKIGHPKVNENLYDHYANMVMSHGH